MDKGDKETFTISGVLLKNLMLTYQAWDAAVMALLRMNISYRSFFNATSGLIMVSDWH